MSLNFGYSPPGLGRIKKDIKMNGHKILDLPSPTLDSEPVTKSYADTHYSGNGSSKGPKGDKGDQGIQGIQGDKGDQGIQGIKGDKGDQGIQGIQGDKGDQGIQGIKGDKGDQGIQGIQGDKEDQGIQGIKGDKGDTGPAGSGGLSATGFTMQGDIDMNNNKITNLPDPTLANDPITKQYANRVYLTDSGFTMQDNIGMNNHEVLGLNPNPSGGTAAVSKDFTDSQYVKKNTDIDMGNNRILNLPFPQSSGEPVTKAYAEMQHFDYLNILTFEGTMNTHTVTHIDDMVDTPFNGRSNYIVDFSKVGTSYQIAFSVTPKLPKGIYAYEMNIELSTSVGYNISLWGDCGGSGYDSSTKYKYWSWGLTNKIKQDNIQGGYFHRATGKKVFIKGTFLNKGTNVDGVEIVMSKDYEHWKTYEFVLQHLGSRSIENILENSIYFVFEPDNNKTMDFTVRDYFQF